MMIKNKRNLFVSGVLLAATAVSVTAYASDLYVGFEGGAQTLDSSLSGYGTYYNQITGTLNNSFSSSATALGGVGDLYVGVASHPISKMYLALEANITGFSAESNETYEDASGTEGEDNTVKTQLKYSFGVSIIPGYMLTDKTTLYARMGVGYGEFKTSSSGENDGWVGQVGYSGECVDHDFSYRLGLGMETYFMPKLSARLEYDYWHYNTFQPSNVTGYDNFEYSYTFHPSANTVMLGVSYHFYQKGGDGGGVTSHA